MPNLSTTYMGLKLTSPVIVGSCSLSKRVVAIQAAEAAGAGALVIKSLFEEQIQLESVKLDAELNNYAEMIGEALSFHPKFEHGGPSEHLLWVEKARKAVKMPLIASLNAISTGEWTRYAVQLENTGVDALELNLFSVITDPGLSGHDVMKAMLSIVHEIRSRVRIPISIKMSPYFAAPLYAAAEFEKAGANALVLFNRLAQPDIDIHSEKLSTGMVLSAHEEIGHSLRWIGLMHGIAKTDLCAATGIHTSDCLIKALLAGASAVQVVSTLYMHGVKHISTLNQGLTEWMNVKGYRSIGDFQGKVSRQRTTDPYAFERAQYVKALLGFD